MVKVCNKCHSEKQIEAFNRSGSGHCGHCKQCESEKARAKYLKNQSVIKVRVQVYRAKNIEKARESQRRFYAENRDRVLATQAAAYKRDPAPIKRRVKRYRDSNLDLVRDRLMNWRRENPEALRMYRENRRARKANAEGHFSSGDVARILEKQKWRCANCACCIRHEYHVDHIYPLALGGSNWPSNLQGLCKTCNLRKSTKHPVEFAQENGRLL